MRCRVHMTMVHGDLSKGHLGKSKPRPLPPRGFCLGWEITPAISQAQAGLTRDRPYLSLPAGVSFVSSLQCFLCDLTLPFDTFIHYTDALKRVREEPQKVFAGLKRRAYSRNQQQRHSP